MWLVPERQRSEKCRCRRSRRWRLINKVEMLPLVSMLPRKGSIFLSRSMVTQAQRQRSWVERMRPVIKADGKVETQEYIRKIKEGYDWRKYRKDFKNPRRKGNDVMNQVRAEELSARSQKYEVPDFRAGDAVELDLLYELNSDKRQIAKGLVLGRVNRGVDSSVLLYCVVANTPHVRSIPIYSPLVQNMTIIQRNFLHKGKKRVRRAKLYYLLDQNKPIRAP